MVADHAAVLSERNPLVLRKDEDSELFVNFLMISTRILLMYFRFDDKLHDVPVWRNGRRYRLKICCPFGRGGSSPSTGTIKGTSLKFR